MEIKIPDWGGLSLIRLCNTSYRCLFNHVFWFLRHNLLRLQCTGVTSITESVMEFSHVLGHGVVALIESFYLKHTAKKESQNGSPRRAIWLSVTQLSMELHFGATLYRRAVSEAKKRSDLALHIKREP